MNYKLHIDLSKGLIEAEGDKDFVMHVYKDFKDSVAKVRAVPDNAASHVSPPVSLIEQGAQTQSNATAKAAPAKKGKSAKSTVPTLNKNLNLYAEGKQPSLKDFIAGYNAQSNQDKNLLFVYYLKEIKNVDNIGVDEVFTCYKHLGLKIPSVSQGLRSTAFNKGWLDTSSMDDIKVTIGGQNAVTHDLVKSEAA